MQISCPEHKLHNPKCWICALIEEVGQLRKDVEILQQDNGAQKYYYTSSVAQNNFSIGCTCPMIPSLCPKCGVGHLHIAECYGMTGDPTKCDNCDYIVERR